MPRRSVRCSPSRPVLVFREEVWVERQRVRDAGDGSKHKERYKIVFSKDYRAGQTVVAVVLRRGHGFTQVVVIHGEWSMPHT